MIAILFGGIMGLGFGCCEEVFKDTFKEHSRRVLGEKYNGSQNKADKVSAKSWVYMKRAHLHSQTMGVISIVLSLIAAGLDGIENKRALEEAYMGDAYTGDDLREIPKTLREAIVALDGSTMLREALGDHVIEHYVHTARWEQSEFDRQVTDWEVKRGFERS